MVLFTVSITLKDSEGLPPIPYESIHELVHDEWLPVLFEREMVSEVSVTSCHGKHIAKPPVLTWERLLNDVVDNAATIWREGLR